MQTKRFVLVIAILMGVLAWAVEPGQCTPDGIPCGVLLKPKGNPTGAGPMILEFRLRMELPFESLVVRVETYGKLIYAGPTSWIVRNDGRDTLWYELNIVVPANDTSGIMVDMGCNADAQYFVTTGDTMEIYHSWPKPPEPPYSTAVFHSKGNKHHVPGSEIPPWKRPPQKPVIKIMTSDSAGWRDPRVNPQAADSTNGLDEGGGKLPRYSGPKVVDSAGWSTIDGLREAAQKDMEKESNKKRELIVDLRKPEDYNYMKTLATELIPCDTAGYFRVKLTRAQAKEVHDRGIAITSSRPAPGPHPAPKGKQ
jgi:hypothetical protein